MPLRYRSCHANVLYTPPHETRCPLTNVPKNHLSSYQMMRILYKQGIKSPKYNAEHRVQIITSVILWKGGDVTSYWRQPTTKFPQLAIHKQQIVTALASIQSLNIHVLPRTLLNLTKTYTNMKMSLRAQYLSSAVLSAIIVLVHNWARFCWVSTQHLSTLPAQAPSLVFSLRPPHKHNFSSC